MGKKMDRRLSRLESKYRRPEKPSGTESGDFKIPSFNDWNFAAALTMICSKGRKNKLK